MFVGLLNPCTTASFGESLASNFEGRMKCVSLNNWSCQYRPTLVIIKSDEPLYYPFTGSVNKCGWSCNNIYDSYA